MDTTALCLLKQPTLTMSFSFKADTTAGDTTLAVLLVSAFFLRPVYEYRCAYMLVCIYVYV